ncbi:uncharacterized protein L203_103867 [Cryptococcus depauperatus CBS 7841]|uniref:Uncharacterized protein n=1 Tax=Cryptococcus depauperatus CBS 7841 TaxID=1295531 RepID=A0A1E3HJC9_9TREE|nr:endoplasmic reticulum protein [Cryptococcus depauperatus CBS 7841]
MLSDAVPVKTLLLTVFNSIVEVFILCLAGYVLARTGVTDKATQRKLNIINVSLFTPALLFSKVAYSLTPAKLKELWIIPLGFVFITGLSAAVAYVLAKILRLSRSQRAFAMCASMFQNSNSLPIALIQSLVVEVPGLKWGSHDSKDQMLGRALTYLVLYSTLGMMVRWSWGVKLLSKADDEQESSTNGDEHLVHSPRDIDHEEQQPFFPFVSRVNSSGNQGHVEVGSTMAHEAPPSPPVPFTAPGSAHSMHPNLRRLSNGRTNKSCRSHSTSSFTRKIRPPDRTESGREFWGLPEAPKDRGISLIEEDSSDEEGEDEEWGNYAQPNLRLRREPHTRLQAIWRQIQPKITSWTKSVNAFMTVPMYAALLSIAIAMIPPLQAKVAQVKPLEQAIKGAGQCSIPVTLVVLGAFFYSPPPHTLQRGHIQLANTPTKTTNFFERKLRQLAGSNEQRKSYPGENKTVCVAVVSRMIIVPILMMPLLALMAKFDSFKAAEDPVFVLSAVLLVSSPPALTLAQITQVASGDAFEQLISKTISWSYAVLTPPLTLIYVVVGLVFGRL